MTGRGMEKETDGSNYIGTHVDAQPSEEGERARLRGQEYSAVSGSSTKTLGKGPKSREEVTEKKEKEKTKL